jgi:thiol:disulfide interchange protein
LVDFTARWCISCQVNERVALAHPEVVKTILEKGIVLVKGDWTNNDEIITKALASYGKNSVPVYVLYGGASAEPVFLPEILTPGIVLKALEKI